MAPSVQFGKIMSADKLSRMNNSRIETINVLF